MHILYVEDQVEEQASIAKALRSQNHQVTIIDNVFDALSFIRRNEPEILLCDYSLGEGPNGLFVAENTRNLYPACTIVMISCNLNAENAVKAMQIGADDFVARPIRISDLLERLWTSVTRRQRRFSSFQQIQGVDGQLVLDQDRWVATWNGQPLDLTPTEFGLLAHLARKPGQLVTFVDLWAGIRGEQIPSKQAREMLKPHIFKLRAKLHQRGATQDVIQSVRGQGYIGSFN